MVLAQMVLNSFSEMCEYEIKDACQLIAVAMNLSEARWAEKTMRFHFGCKRQGLDDGREYFIYKIEDRIVALVGLHHYEWGPEENVWLAWFAVHPEFQRQGIGMSLVDYVETKAKELGYRKFFVETYSASDFDSARRFYEACGFTQAGTISDYLSDGSSMIVYKRSIN